MHTLLTYENALSPSSIFAIVRHESHAMMDPPMVNNYASIKLVRFFMQFIGMWPSESRRQIVFSNFVLFYTLFTMFFATMVEGMDFYYSWGDVIAMTYCAPCASAVLSALGQLCLFVYIRNEVLRFNSYTEETFWKIKYSNRDLQILSKCNQICIRSCTVFSIILQIIAWHYVTVPVIESKGKNATDRTLPFNLWFNFPYWESPFYEIAYTLQSIATFSVCTCCTTFAIFLFTINIFTAGQFQILQENLLETCNSITNPENRSLAEKSYEKLKSCVTFHQLLINYIERIENLYCFCVLGQVFSSVMQICFSGFQILLGVNTSLTRLTLSVEYFVGSFIQLYFFTWSSQQIIIESEAVFHAAYQSEWYLLPYYAEGKAFRRGIEILMLKARRPCILSVGKFCPLSLETFTSVLRTSISYFTVLREMSEL